MKRTSIAADEFTHGQLMELAKENGLTAAKTAMLMIMALKAAGPAMWREIPSYKNDRDLYVYLAWLHFKSGHINEKELERLVIAVQHGQVKTSPFDTLEAMGLSECPGEFFRSSPLGQEIAQQIESGL